MLFIRKKDFKKLCDRLDDIESALPNIVKVSDEKMCGFATDIGELREDIEELREKVGEFEEEKDVIEQFRELGKSLNEGISNIMKY